MAQTGDDKDEGKGAGGAGAGQGMKPSPHSANRGDAEPVAEPRKARDYSRMSGAELNALSAAEKASLPAEAKNVLAAYMRDESDRREARRAESGAKPQGAPAPELAKEPPPRQPGMRRRGP